MIIQFRKYAIVFIALCLALFFRFFIISVYRIPTDSVKPSMTPTLLPGDFILASQISYGLRFPWSESVWFKSAPQKGDLVVVSFKSKASTSYIKRIAAVEGDEVQTAQGKVKVGPGEVYVLSDNPEVFDDSRDLGMVSIEKIESQPKLIWFSFSGEKQIRWSRIFHIL